MSATSWPAYERVPAWVSEGYGTIFAEIDRPLEQADGAVPTTVVVPVGVGALAWAALRRYGAAGELGTRGWSQTSPVPLRACFAHCRPGTRDGPRTAPFDHGRAQLWNAFAPGVASARKRAVAIDDKQARGSMCRLAAVASNRRDR